MLAQSLNIKKSKFSQKTTYWLLAVTCLLAVTGFLLVTSYRSSFTVTDYNINNWVKTIQSSSFTLIAEVVSFSFDIPVLITISLVASTYMFIKNYRAESLLLLGAMAGDALVVGLTKNLIHAPRPTDNLVVDLGFSYPSGHAAGIMVFCGLLLFFAFRYFQGYRSKALLGVCLAGLVALVGFDRLYLNVHWFSDVLGGYLLGVAWLSFAILLFYVLRGAGVFSDSARFRKASTAAFILAFIVAVGVIAYSVGVISLF